MSLLVYLLDIKCKHIHK